MSVEIIRGLIPSKSNSYRIITLAGHGSMAKTPAMKAYENSFFMQCSNYRNAMIDDMFEFYAKVFYPNNRSDLDGSLKAVLDCLQKSKAITNDNRCIKVCIGKFIDKECPRVEFVINPVGREMDDDEKKFIITI